MAAATDNSGLQNVFIGPNGIRAGWRMAIFLLLFFAMQYIVIQRGLRAIPALGRIANLTIVRWRAHASIRAGL